MFNKMKKIIVSLLVTALIVTQAEGQVTIPTTFTTSVPVSQLNGNFSTLGSSALNRGGGTITGNISVNSGVTIDGVDIGSVLGGSGTPTFSTVTITGAGSALAVTNNVAINGTGATAIDVAGGITAGSGNVGIVQTDGRIPALSSTYFASLSGANLTSIPWTAMTTTWSSQSYSAGNFSASGSQTWTVDVSDVSTNTYAIFGKTMIWTVFILSSSIGGTPSTELRMTIPNSQTVNASVGAAGSCAGYNSGGLDVSWLAVPSNSYIILYTSFGGNWAASTNNQHISCTMIFSIA